MTRLALLPIMMTLIACQTTPRASLSSSQPSPAPGRALANALDARQAFGFLYAGDVRKSRIRQCLYQARSQEMKQFLIVQDVNGFALRENFDGVEPAFPCPKLVQREPNMGWNVAQLIRFRANPNAFECEYLVRGDVYTCELELPSNQGPLNADAVHGRGPNR